jgi:hypothetical protein
VYTRPQRRARVGMPMMLSRDGDGREGLHTNDTEPHYCYLDSKVMTIAGCYDRLGRVCSDATQVA